MGSKDLAGGSGLLFLAAQGVTGSPLTSFSPILAPWAGGLTNAVWYYCQSMAGTVPIRWSRATRRTKNVTSAVSAGNTVASAAPAATSNAPAASAHPRSGRWSGSRPASACLNEAPIPSTQSASSVRPPGSAGASSGPHWPMPLAAVSATLQALGVAGVVVLVVPAGDRDRP